MATIGAILSIARTGLTVQQRASETIGHNIANAATEGYSRQRVRMAAGYPLVTPTGPVGTGVRDGGVERMRDRLLDATTRDHNSSLQGFQERNGALGRVESLFGEPGDNGLGSTLDRFWSAWGDLAGSPTSGAARTLVRERGAQVATHFGRLANGLATVATDTETRLDEQVKRLNALAGEVAELNRRIVADEVGIGTASDLRDRRDAALDAMAGITAVQVVERENGGVGVSVGSATIVDGGGQPRELAVHRIGDTVTIGVAGRAGSSVGETGGRLSAYVHLLNEDLPDMRAQLDELARAVVEQVNTLHRTGVSPTGAADVLFFRDDPLDATDVSASSMALSALVAADSANIAAGVPDGVGGYQAGDNSVALGMAALRYGADAGHLGGATIADFYAGMVTDLGTQVRSADDGVEASTRLMEQADMRRQSVAGVSIDEELVYLMEHQNAYAAAARLVQTADEMMRTLLDMV